MEDDNSAMSSPIAAPSDSPAGGPALRANGRTPTGTPSGRRASLSHVSGSEMSTPQRVGTPLQTPGSSWGTGSYRRETPGRQRYDLAGGVGRRRNGQGSQTPRGSGFSEDGAGPSLSEAADEAEAQRTFVWGTDVDVAALRTRFTRFVRNYREEEREENKYARLLEEIVERDGNTFNVDCQNIFSYDPELYRLLVRYPLEVIPIFDIVVGDMAAEIRPEYHIPILTRLFNLKETVNLRDLNPSDIDQLVAVKGMVIRTSSIIPDIKFAFFQCLVCNMSPDPVIVEKGAYDSLALSLSLSDLEYLSAV